MNNPELNIIPAVAGSVEDNIMASDPANRVEQIANADKALSDKVTGALEPQSEAVEEGNSEEGTPEPEGKEYEPAKEFLDFIQGQIEGGYNTPEQQQQRALSPNEPQHQTVADDSSVQDDETVQSQMDKMEEMIHDLSSTIYSDRQQQQDRNAFEQVNGVYLDAIKDVPDEARSLVDVWNNAVLGYHDLKSIDKALIEGSTKAMTSELDNYFNARVASEGYAKSGSTPPSTNSLLGEITPPPSTGDDFKGPENRPKSAFDDADRDFVRKVNNLFSQ
jgi:hypothetical protein